MENLPNLHMVADVGRKNADARTAKKSRRGGTPWGILPRRLTLQRATRRSRVALQLVVRHDLN